MNESSNNKRIAKNTLVLYIRMLFLMAISLYTSRVILQALGVEDFGIYNVVGGFVALFGVISKSLSSAASRFLTYEMGKGDWERLKKVFSTTLTIHLFLAIIIAILSEAVGIWFVNNKMVLDASRIDAANWVFQFSVLTFCCNLIAVPFNAAIIAHERMTVFAYISIFEGIGKLLICFLVMNSPIDRLVYYGFLMFFIHLCVIVMYWWYCKSHFSECHYRYIYDAGLLKEIFGFASWNMIGASAAVLRNQGGTVLINLFGGPVVNAARAIANQVLHAVSGFVDSFMMALRPQITKSYASGNTDYMMALIFQGSRFSYYMLLFLCLPILINTDFILHLWLKTVPDHAVPFVQLTLVFIMLESLSYTLITAQLATGNIRNYQLIVGGLQIMNIPVSYVILKFGGIPETILFVAIFFSVLCLIARLIMLKRIIPFEPVIFAKRVVCNVLMVTFSSAIIPIVIYNNMPVGLLNFILVSSLCFICTSASVLYVGSNERERMFLYNKIRFFLTNRR